MGGVAASGSTAPKGTPHPPFTPRTCSACPGKYHRRQNPVLTPSAPCIKLCAVRAMPPGGGIRRIPVPVNYDLASYQCFSWSNSGKKVKVVSHLLSPRQPAQLIVAPLYTPKGEQSRTPVLEGHRGVTQPAQASRVVLPLPGALSTDLHQLQPHTGQAASMKSRTALLGLSPSASSCSLPPQLISAFEDLSWSTLTCPSSLPTPPPCAAKPSCTSAVPGSKAGPSRLPRGVPGAETSLGLRGRRKSPANPALRGQGWL